MMTTLIRSSCLLEGQYQSSPLALDEGTREVPIKAKLPWDEYMECASRPLAFNYLAYWVF